MLHGSDNGERRKTLKRNRAYSQPLIAGLFCLLLILLFLATALMDIRRTQSVLLDVFENKGVSIIESVDRITAEKLKAVMGITDRTTLSFQDMETIEQGFRLQEAVLTRLIELGRELDRRMTQRTMKKEELEAFALERHLQAIVVCDMRGNIIMESAPIPNQLALTFPKLIKKEDKIVVDLQELENGRTAVPLIGIPRIHGDERIVFILGMDGFHYWALSVALQEAVEEGGWRKGVHYFLVVDSQNRIIAGAGDLPEETVEIDGLSDNGPTTRRNPQSGRRMLKGPPDLLEVHAPLQLSDSGTYLAKVGMEVEEANVLRKKNQIHIFITAGTMMGIAVFGLLLFYRLQSRYQDRLQGMRERLDRAERLSSLGKLAAGVAHEIRNPLNGVSMAIQRIRREFSPPESQNRQEFFHLIEIVREEIGRLNRIIEDFVGPIREKHTAYRPERLEVLLDRVIHIVKEEADFRGIRVALEYETPGPFVRMDSARMHQALLNLIKNALESIPDRGEIKINIFPRDDHHVRIRIADTGEGIRGSDLQKIFDFEYTTKEKGLGLGLPIASEIIQAHGGDIHIESEPGKGTTVHITLPCTTG